ncbi:MAG: glutamyl-tRNA reductase [Verrucomicrobiota bacterium]|nr:glutamyl-tRNA reductase [Verrucomicrobiota bacterium]
MIATNGMSLHLLGSSHQIADLDVREKIGLTQEMIDDFYDGLGKLPGLTECVLLNTCNRTEIYGVSKDNFSLDYIHNYLSEFRQLDPEFLKMYSYRRSGEEVVRHLFEVTSGIDSQMVGETEILGQVKKAYEEARKRKFSGKIMNRLFQKGFQAAKWARTHTGISKGQVNLGNVLCELARRIFGKVSNSRLLIVGAGEVAESAMEAFKSRGSQEITVTGRTFDWCPLSRNKPDELAEKYGGYALAYSQFKNSLHHFDVILTSTSSAKSLLGEYEIKAAMAKRPAKPLFLVDASVPRNIDPRVSRIDNVFLYNMDDVSEIANENLKSRIAEVDRCRLTLSKKAIRLWSQMCSQPVNPDSSSNQSAPSL